MLLGMDDWVVSCAYLSTIGIAVVGVIYGALNYNRGDDSTASEEEGEQR